jgi:hypothetical protein
MNFKFVKVFAGYYIFLSRSIFVAFGCVAICWGLVEFPIFLREAPIERIAHQITAGEHFPAQAFDRQLPIFEGIENSTHCRPAVVRSAAIFRIRSMEVAASEPGHGRVDELVNFMVDSIRRSLSCSPADPFLWLVLYWGMNTQNGFQSDNLKFLRMSYQLGPNEGWIGIKRNRLALVRNGSLPPDLAKAALNEFVGLVQSEFYQQTSEMFIALDAKTKMLVLESLKHIPEIYLDQLFLALRGIGYDNEQFMAKDWRPWQ